MLNEQQYQAKWPEIRDGIKNLWGKLTDDELNMYKGNLTEVSGLVEERYGETKEEIKMKLDHLMDSFDNETDKGIAPDVSSFQRSPLTTEKSQNLDSDIKTRSSERKAFDDKTYDASKTGSSNYSGANPGRERLADKAKSDFDADRNARH